MTLTGLCRYVVLARGSTPDFFVCDEPVNDDKVQWVSKPWDTDRDMFNPFSSLLNNLYLRYLKHKGRNGICLLCMVQLRSYMKVDIPLEAQKITYIILLMYFGLEDLIGWDVVIEQGIPRSAISECTKILDLPDARCSLLKVSIIKCCVDILIFIY